MSDTGFDLPRLEHKLKIQVNYFHVQIFTFPSNIIHSKIINNYHTKWLIGATRMSKVS